MSAFPNRCPLCDAPWRFRSKTMGANRGQPHHGRCQSGHDWREGMSQRMVLPDTAWLSDIPQRPQRQDSLSDQLHDLTLVATRLGMYDAADWLARATDFSCRAEGGTR